MTRSCCRQSTSSTGTGDWVQAYGNYASAVLFSPENEEMVYGPRSTTPEAAAAFDRHIEFWRAIDAVVKAADPMRRPLHHHGANGLVAAPEYLRYFEVIGVHYPISGLGRLAQWTEFPAPTPVMIGERNYSGQGYEQEPEAAGR